MYFYRNKNINAQITNEQHNIAKNVLIKIIYIYYFQFWI